MATVTTNGVTTFGDYVAKKGRKELSAAIRHISDRIAGSLASEEVPAAHRDADLRVALGAIRGQETEEQREAIDTLLRLASWDGVESVPQTGDLARANAVDREKFAKLNRLREKFDMRPVALSQLAKKRAAAILRDNIDSEFVEREHGGEWGYAVDAVLGNLFPNRKSREEVLTNREEYLARMVDELIALL